MKRWLGFFLVFLYLGLRSHFLFARQHEIDSLRNVLQNTTVDTVKVELLALLSLRMATIQPAQAFAYAQEALTLGTKLNYQKGVSSALNYKGVIHKNMANYDSAMFYYVAALKIKEQIGDKQGIAYCLNNIGVLYERFFQQPGKALEYHFKALKIKQEIGERKTVATSLNNIGKIHKDLKNYDSAHHYFTRALEIRKATGDKKGMASSLNAIGDIYVFRQRYDTAMLIYQQAYMTEQQLGDRHDLSITLLNMGKVNQLQHKHRQAVTHLEKSLEHARALHAKDLMEKIYFHLAGSYENLENFDKSSACYKLALLYKDSLTNERLGQQMAEMRARFDLDTRDKEIQMLNKESQVKNAIHDQDILIRNVLIIGCLVAMTSMLLVQRSVKKTRRRNYILTLQKQEIMLQRDALEEKTVSLQQAHEEIMSQRDSLEEKTVSLQQAHEEIMAQRDDLEEKTRRLLQANEEILKQKEEIETQRDNIEEQHQMISVALEDIKILSSVGQELTATLDFETSFMRLYQYISNLMKADIFSVLIYNQQANTLDDIYSLENGEKMPPESIPLDDETRLGVISVRYRKEICINDYDVEYAQYVPVIRVVYGEKPNSVIYVPLVVEDKVIGAITVQSFQKNAYSEYVFNVMKTLAAYTAIALDNANAYKEISRHKEIIDEKNKNITDSIRYAQTMQKAMLPTDELLKEAFAEHFMIYQPRDIVSGDFYWCAIEDNQVFVAVVDCTGHGVPGAFMSLIGVSLFNDIVKQRHIYSPKRILEELHEGVQAIFKQESKMNNDGMDVCLCRIDRLDDHKTKVTFAGAKRPLLHLDQATGKISRIKGGFYGIGGWDVEDVFFTEQELTFNSGDLIYLTSDGLTDQDNMQRDKFGSQRLKALLQDIRHHSMQKQGEIVLTEIFEYMGDKPQRDDMSFMGIKL